MAFRTRRRFVVRAKRKGAWSGTFINDFAVSDTVTSSYLVWDTVDTDELGVTGVATHRVTHIHLGAAFGQSTAGVVPKPFAIGWYLAIFPTEPDGLVSPTQLIWPALPSAAQPATQPLQKRLQLAGGLWFPSGIMANPQATNTPLAALGVHEVIKARHRLTQEDNLVLCFQSSHPTRVTFRVRSYFST